MLQRLTGRAGETQSWWGGRETGGRETLGSRELLQAEPSRGQRVGTGTWGEGP